jgi:hypothetical protein
MMNVIFLACVGFCFSSAVVAAVIDGPANIRDKPNGRIIASLDDGVSVECKHRVGDWYLTAIAVKIPSVSVEQNHVKKNTVLVTASNKPVGKTVSSTPLLYPKLYWDGFTGKIEAYTHAQNLRKPSDSCPSVN